MAGSVQHWEHIHGWIGLGLHMSESGMQLTRLGISKVDFNSLNLNEGRQKTHAEVFQLPHGPVLRRDG
jgi:hypothetical protein